MNRRAGFAAAAIAVLLGGACGRIRPAPAIDAELASFVPPDTQLLAGADLTKLRQSPFYRTLPPSITSALDTYSNVSRLLVEFGGGRLLIVARGPFAKAPPGARLIGGNIALYGSPEAIQAGIAQHAAGVPGVPALLTRADPLAAANPIWLVANTGAPFPLTGNLANLNRALRDADFVTATAQLDKTMTLHAAALGRTAAAADDLENDLGGMLSLATAAESRNARAAALLRAIQIRREDRTVHISLTLAADELTGLLNAIAQ